MESWPSKLQDLILTLGEREAFKGVDEKLRKVHGRESVPVWDFGREGFGGREGQRKREKPSTLFEIMLL